MRLTSALAAVAAAGTVLFVSSTLVPANAMGPAGPAAAKKADASLVQTVRHRRYYRRSYSYYAPRRYYRPYYRPYYYSYAPDYSYYPTYRTYYYGSGYPSYYYGAAYPYYRPYYYGPRYYGGGVGVYGRGFGVRVGW